MKIFKYISYRELAYFLNLKAYSSSTLQHSEKLTFLTLLFVS